MKSRALCVLALAGCPKTDEPATTDTGDTTDTTDTVTDTTDTTQTGCAPITVGAFEGGATGDGAASYLAPLTSPLGGDPLDYLNLQLYGAGFAAGLDGEETGTFTVGAGEDGNYATCSRCLLAFEDAEVDVATRSYFGVSGTLTVDKESLPLDGLLYATVTDAVLVEVTIDPATFESTPVEGGACLELATATIVVGAKQ